MRLFTIDGCDPFLPTLAERLVDGTLWPDGKAPDDPFALARATIYLPTRRAARALSNAVLAATARTATVLPRIASLDEADEGVAGPSHASVLPAAPAKAALAMLIRAFAERTRGEDGARPLLPTSAANDIRLAADLLSLMEQVETQEADWSALPGLVEAAELAAHWEITTRFLEIATTHWPAHLKSAGMLSEAAARTEAAEAARARVPHACGPLIVAGSTGSIPATRRLMAVIAQSPWGAVVLPALDRSARPADWAALDEASDGPAHPQYGMLQLLKALSAAPHEVARLEPRNGGRSSERAAVFAAALRPAVATADWQGMRAAMGGKHRLATALAHVALVEAPDERMEAAAIAVAMRESVALGERVALVTPHRPLARRVRHALARWDIDVDDSAGEPLLATEAGTLTRLIVQAAAGAAPADWLALAKHPALAAALPSGTAMAVERALRGRPIAPHHILTMLAQDGDAARAFAERARAALAPLLDLPMPAGTDRLADATARAVAAVAGSEMHGEELMAARLGELAAAPGLAVTLADWPGALDALLADDVVRRPAPGGALAILGPLEARLQSFDHVVLGGLNEGRWPPTADAGPWMSRGMMHAFGIELPERRIGLAAHDVATLAQQPRATLTRAKAAAGEPTVASRWWQRLLAFAGPGAEPATKRGERLVALASTMDHAPPVDPASRPCPKPPPAARPKTISVTEVSRLIRDPYALYARRILRLKPLDPVDPVPDAGDRGSVIHAALAAFVRRGGARAADPHAAFRAAAQDALVALDHAPDARALWGARLEAMAPAIIAWDRARSGTPYVEIAGEMRVGTHRLRGRLDRIDILSDGTATIVDYKTGAPPSRAEAAALEPQLALEGALAKAGALEEAEPVATVEALDYLVVGKARKPVEPKSIASGDEVDGLITDAQTRLAALLSLYDQEAQGYLSRARVKFAKETSGDYDHLARVAEWSK